MRVVVYNSRMGSTKKYAEWFAQSTGLKAFSLDEAKTEVSKEDEVIFFSWNLHAKIQEVDKAEKLFNIIAYAILGMQPSGTMVQELKDSNFIPEEKPLFTLIGRYYSEENTGMYKLIMKMVTKTFVKNFNNTPEDERTEVDKMMVHFLTEGGDHVQESELAEILRWYRVTYPSTATPFDAVSESATPESDLKPFVAEAPVDAPVTETPSDPTLKPFIAGEE